LSLLATAALLFVTALAEIAGCYLPFLWLRRHGSPWLLVPAAASLALFAYLLSLHPTAGRAYAAYGGAYVTVALGWLWLVERQIPTPTDLAGAGLALLGMTVIVIGGALR